MVTNTQLIAQAVEVAAEGAYLPRDPALVAYLSIETDSGGAYDAAIIIATDGNLDAIEQCRRCQVLLRFNLRDFFAYLSQYGGENKSDEDSDDSGYVIQQYEGNEDDIAAAFDKLLSCGKGFMVVDAFSEF